MYRQPRPRRQNVLSRDVIRTYVNISAKSTEISAIVPSFPVISVPRSHDLSESVLLQLS